MRKKHISLLLVLCMVLSMLPITAFAAPSQAIVDGDADWTLPDYVAYAKKWQTRFEKEQSWYNMIPMVYYYQQAILRDETALPEIKNYMENEVTTLDLHATSADDAWEDNEGNNQADDGALVYFTGLTILNLADNNLKSFGSLKDMSKLETLNLSGNPDLTMAAYGALANKPNLTDLNLSGTGIENLGGLKDAGVAGNLTTLDISDCKNLKHTAEGAATAEDYFNTGALEDFTKLENLSMRNLKVDDLGGLKNLTNLKNLDISGVTFADNKPVDLGPLVGLELDSVIAKGVTLKDLGALKALLDSGVKVDLTGATAPGATDLKNDQNASYYTAPDAEVTKVTVSGKVNKGEVAATDLKVELVRVAGYTIDKDAAVNPVDASADGSYTFSEVTPGTYYTTISGDVSGFKFTASKEFTVKEKQTDDITIDPAKDITLQALNTESGVDPDLVPKPEPEAPKKDEENNTVVSTSVSATEVSTKKEGDTLTVGVEFKGETAPNKAVVSMPVGAIADKKIDVVVNAPVATTDATAPVKVENITVEVPSEAFAKAAKQYSDITKDYTDQKGKPVAKDDADKWPTDDEGKALMTIKTDENGNKIEVPATCVSVTTDFALVVTAKPGSIKNSTTGTENSSTIISVSMTATGYATYDTNQRRTLGTKNIPISEFGDVITITATAPEDMNGALVWVYYVVDSIIESNGLMTPDGTRVTDGKFSFKTGHLSDFAVTTEKVAVPDDDTDDDKTPGGGNHGGGGGGGGGSSKPSITGDKDTTTTTPTTPSTTNRFTDVQSGAYYYDAVMWAVENGITNGTSADKFSPNSTCTRAEMVTFLWRAAGSPAPTSTTNPFSDIASAGYYYDAVLWAVEKGITNGTSATTFSPSATVTRGQTVTFLFRASGETAQAGSSAFADVAGDAYYAEAVRWASNKGVTNGTSATTFSPDNGCTRGQIVTFLYRDQIG